MPADHKDSSPRRTPAIRRGFHCLGVAVTVASVTLVSVTDRATTAEHLSVNLAALITPASSTAQFFATSQYYNVDWEAEYGAKQVVPFFLGPQGIVESVDENSNDPSGVVVLSSGWGAGQTSTALSIMHDNSDPAQNSTDLVVLDNNTNRAAGGFWTTYWMFAPLLHTSNKPPPEKTIVPVVDVAYQYNINSNAPTYATNGIALLNSLAAYIVDYRGQRTAPMPEKALQPVDAGGQHYHYIVQPDGSYTTSEVDGNITYVTFAKDGLPLLAPLRVIPGGDAIADLLEPELTKIVEAGYANGQSIPEDPTVTQPVRLFPPRSQTAATHTELGDAAQETLNTASTNRPSSGGSVTNAVEAINDTVTESSASSRANLDNAASSRTTLDNQVTGTKSPTAANSDVLSADTAAESRHDMKDGDEVRETLASPPTGASNLDNAA